MAIRAAAAAAAAAAMSLCVVCVCVCVGKMWMDATGVLLLLQVFASRGMKCLIEGKVRENEREKRGQANEQSNTQNKTTILKSGVRR